MKAILRSIHPSECEKIFNKTKTIDTLKTRPKLTPPFTVYVYQTKTKFKVKNWQENFQSIVFTPSGGVEEGNGKVIGSFICNKIIELPCETTQPNWLKEKTCLSDSQYMNYLGHTNGYGWHITEPKLFDTPKKLSDFRKPCVDKYEYCQGCKHGLITIPPDEEEYALYHGGYYDTFDTVCLNTVSRPPRSWCYVEEQK